MGMEETRHKPDKRDIEKKRKVSSPAKRKKKGRKH
jgi:hypothetical protein